MQSPTRSFNIRTACAADATALADTYEASVTTLAARFYSPAIMNILGRRPAPEIFAQRLTEGETFFAAFKTPEVGASYILGWSRHGVIDDDTHTLGLYVRPEAKGTGLSTALYDRAEQLARSQGAKQLKLESLRGADQFYARMGMTQTGEREHQMANGSTLVVASMLKRLTPSS